MIAVAKPAPPAVYHAPTSATQPPRRKQPRTPRDECRLIRWCWRRDRMQLFREVL